MIIKAKLIDTDKIWKLLDLANDSSLSHYTKEEIKIFKIENTKNLIKKYIVDHNYISLVYLNKTRNITGYCVYNTHQHILYRLYVSPETQ